MENLRNSSIISEISHAPVALFVYNRPWHVQQTIEALKKNILAQDTDLFVFSDAPRCESAITNVFKVREYLKEVKGFRSITVILRDMNYGLERSIIEGVTEVVNRFGKVIVMEDDLISSQYFLNFMNEGLIFYQNEGNVLSIQGYIYPLKAELPELFFLKGAGCWGWATWKRAWDLFERDGKKLLEQLKKYGLTEEFDYGHTYKYTELLEGQVNGKVETWAVRWYASVFLHGGLSLYPGRSFIRHIGSDGSGTNFGKSDLLDVEISNEPVNLKKIPIVEAQWIRKEFTRYFKSIKPSLSCRIVHKIINFAKEYVKKP